MKRKSDSYFVSYMPIDYNVGCLKKCRVDKYPCYYDYWLWVHKQMGICVIPQMTVLLYLFDFHKGIESEYKFSVEITVRRNSEQIIFMTLVIYNHTYNLFLKNSSFVLPLHISRILSQSWVICFQVTYLVNKKVKKLKIPPQRWLFIANCDIYTNQ